MHGAGIDEPLLRLTGATNSPSATQAAYLQDGLGAVIGTTNPAGTLTANQRFDAWGNKLSTTTTPTYGYTGREPDATVSFSTRLKKERELAGLSQTRLARMCNLSGPMISCLERGASAGSEKAVTSMARALGIRPEWLRFGAGKRELDCPDDLAGFQQAAPQPFPDRIKKLRKEAGLSQKQLANFIGVSTSAVSCWETGTREIPAGNNLVRLAEALGLDPAEVVKIDGKGATPRNEVRLLAAFRGLPTERQLEAIKRVEALK